MTCKCGYDFAKEMLAVTRGADPCSKSYAVINDANYRKFLKSELKAYTAESKKKRLKALGKSAQFVGTMHVCPECDRLVLNLPDADETASFIREG